MAEWLSWLADLFIPIPLQVTPGLAPDWVETALQDRTIFTGQFAVYGQDGSILYTLPGRIVKWRAFPTDVYIFRPPADLRSLPHGPCLQLVSPGSHWYKLHWEKPARSFETSLAYVEDLLSQIPTHRLQSLSNRR